MRIEVNVPELGDSGDEEATVSFWYYDGGEEVAADEDLVELLTDKATFNVTVPASGILVETRAAEGDTVKTGDILCVIEAREVQ